MTSNFVGPGGHPIPKDFVLDVEGPFRLVFRLGPKGHFEGLVRGPYSMARSMTRAGLWHGAIYPATYFAETLGGFVVDPQADNCSVELLYAHYKVSIYRKGLICR